MILSKRPDIERFLSRPTQGVRARLLVGIGNRQQHQRHRQGEGGAQAADDAAAIKVAASGASAHSNVPPANRTMPSAKMHRWP